jgi:hypothetical protein
LTAAQRRKHAERETVILSYLTAMAVTTHRILLTTATLIVDSLLYFHLTVLIHFSYLMLFASKLSLAPTPRSLPITSRRATGSLRLRRKTSFHRSGGHGSLPLRQKPSLSSLKLLVYDPWSQRLYLIGSREKGVETVKNIPWCLRTVTGARWSVLYALQ